MKPWNYAKVEIKCPCGVVFLRPPSKANRKFCSMDCTGRTPRKNCETCGDEIKVNRYRLGWRAHHFCSFECRCEFFRKRITIACDNCGKPFRKKLSQYSRSKFNFCAHLCSQAFHSGENHPMFISGESNIYGPGWNAIARQVRARDVVCQHCGKTKEEAGRELDVHHKRPFRLFGFTRRIQAHRLSNLIALCKSCHSKAEPR